MTHQWSVALDNQASERARSDSVVPAWIRIAMVMFVAVPHLAIGIWAMLAPAHWFESFPGLGPALIAGEPPFNRHLATDVGTGFFAIGVAVLLAAWIGTRRPVNLALAVLVAFTAPHVVYHLRHPAAGLSTTADIANVALLASSIALAIGLWWGASRADDEPRTGPIPPASKATTTR